MTTSIRRSLAHSFAGSYLILAVQFLSSVVVARILSPEEFGLYSVAMVFVAMGEILRSSGTTNFIIKEKELTKVTLESAYTLSIIIAIIVALLQYSLAPLIGAFYDSLHLETLLKILTINILLSPFGIITQSQLRRDLRIKELNIATFISQIVSCLITISLALSGWGVYSLAAGLISASISLVIILQFYRYPNHPIKLGTEKLKKLAAFSTLMSGTNIISHLGGSSQDWILGKYLGMESVGLYSRAITTTGLYDKLITNSFNKLLAPIFAEKNRRLEELAPTFFKLTSIQIMVAWPSLTLIAAYSSQIVTTLFGDQWYEAAILIKWLCFTKMLMVITQPSNNILAGLGFAKELFKANLIIHPIRIISIFISMPYGLVIVVAVTETACQLARSLIHGNLLSKHLEFSISHFFQHTGTSFFAALITSALLALSAHADSAYLQLSLILFSFVAWLSLAAYFKLEIIDEILSFYKAILKTKKASN